MPILVVSRQRNTPGIYRVWDDLPAPRRVRQRTTANVSSAVFSDVSSALRRRIQRDYELLGLPSTWQQYLDQCWPDDWVWRP